MVSRMLPDGLRARTAPDSRGKSSAATDPTHRYASSRARHDWSSSLIRFSTFSPAIRSASLSRAARSAAASSRRLIDRIPGQDGRGHREEDDDCGHGEALNEGARSGGGHPSLIPGHRQHQPHPGEHHRQHQGGEAVAPAGAETVTHRASRLESRGSPSAPPSDRARSVRFSRVGNPAVRRADPGHGFLAPFHCTPGTPRRAPRAAGSIPLPERPRASCGARAHCLCCAGRDHQTGRVAITRTEEANALARPGGAGDGGAAGDRRGIVRALARDGADGRR